MGRTGVLSRRTPGRAMVAALAALVLVVTGCSADPGEQAETTGRDGGATASPGPARDTALGNTTDPAADTPTDPAPDTATPTTRTATPTTRTATPTEQTAASVTVSGVSEPLERLVQDFYAGEEVTAAGPVREAVVGAPPVAEDVDVTGTQGHWRGASVAVLTAGDDLTLAVDDGAGWRVVGGRWPSRGVDHPVLGGGRHVLLIGSDAREREGQPVDRLRADSLQVLGVDGNGGGGVMGIARDAWVTMPGGGKAKINNAMVEAGPQGQVETVTRVTGLPIEGYVLVGFEGFTGFVDDWGGVKIDAPSAFDGYPAGVQTLSGYWLLRWTRHRYTLPQGDFDRSFHQGVALTGMGLQARGMGPEALPALLERVDRHMESDLDAEQILTFAAWTYLAQPGEFGHEVAKGDFGWSDDGQSIVLLDEAAQDTFEDFADGSLAD
ncbi:MAG: LCP family protein [Actinomycetota bacterium]|nr:LCP family protein [Actinomycetota bacterium]